MKVVAESRLDQVSSATDYSFLVGDNMQDLVIVDAPWEKKVGSTERC